ncbi:hypothetical protein [Ekhidna sp.]
MKKKVKSWKDYHHQLYQVYHSIIALTLVPFAFFFLEWDSSFISPISMSNPFFILIAQSIWVVGYASWYVWRGENIKYQITDSADVAYKMGEFKKRNIRKYLILGGAGIISVAAMWLAPSFIFVIAYFAVLIQYSFLRPSEDKFVRDMRLSKEDRKTLHEE